MKKIKLLVLPLILFLLIYVVLFQTFYTKFLIQNCDKVYKKHLEEYVITTSYKSESKKALTIYLKEKPEISSPAHYDYLNNFSDKNISDSGCIVASSINDFTYTSFIYDDLKNFISSINFLKKTEYLISFELNHVHYECDIVPNNHTIIEEHLKSEHFNGILDINLLIDSNNIINETRYDNLCSEISSFCFEHFNSYNINRIRIDISNTPSLEKYSSFNLENAFISDPSIINNIISFDYYKEKRAISS